MFSHLSSLLSSLVNSPIVSSLSLDAEGGHGHQQVFLTQERIYVNPQYFSPAKQGGGAIQSSGGTGGSSMSAIIRGSPDDKYPWLKKE